jgi:hypothetical protein
MTPNSQTNCMIIVCQEKCFRIFAEAERDGGRPDLASPRLAPPVQIQSRGNPRRGTQHPPVRNCMCRRACLRVCVCLPPTFIRAKQKMERSICCLVLVPSANVFWSVIRYKRSQSFQVDWIIWNTSAHRGRLLEP